MHLPGAPARKPASPRHGGCGPIGPGRGTDGRRGTMAGMRPDSPGSSANPQPGIRDLQGVGDAERGNAGGVNTDTGLDEAGARQGTTRSGNTPGGGSTGIDSGGGGGSNGASGGTLSGGSRSAGAIGTASGGNLHR